MTQHKQDKRFVWRYAIGMLSPWVVLTGTALWLMELKANTVFFWALIVPALGAMYFVHRRAFSHYQCRDCKSQCKCLFKDKGDKVNFYCERCDTTWETGLVYRADD